MSSSDEKMAISEDNTILFCPVSDCKKVFNSTWSLTRHIRTHTGDKQFKCSQCGKDFVEKCALKRHEQTHDQSKPWSCNFPDCGRKFKLKEYLDVHKRMHAKTDQPEISGIADDQLDEMGSMNLTGRRALPSSEILQSEEYISLKNESEQMKSHLKDICFAFEISLSLLQSSSNNPVPSALTDVLNKVKSANNNFAKEEKIIPKYNPPPPLLPPLTSNTDKNMYIPKIPSASTSLSIGNNSISQSSNFLSGKLSINQSMPYFLSDGNYLQNGLSFGNSQQQQQQQQQQQEVQHSKQQQLLLHQSNILPPPPVIIDQRHYETVSGNVMDYVMPVAKRRLDAKDNNPSNHSSSGVSSGLGSSPMDLLAMAASMFTSSKPNI